MRSFRHFYLSAANLDRSTDRCTQLLPLIHTDITTTQAAPLRCPWILRSRSVPDLPRSFGHTRRSRCRYIADARAAGMCRQVPALAGPDGVGEPSSGGDAKHPPLRPPSPAPADDDGPPGAAGSKAAAEVEGTGTLYIEADKSARLDLCACSKVHTRAFHLAWSSFHLASRFFGGGRFGGFQLGEARSCCCTTTNPTNPTGVLRVVLHPAAPPHDPGLPWPDEAAGLPFPSRVSQHHRRRTVRPRLPVVPDLNCARITDSTNQTYIYRRNQGPGGTVDRLLWPQG